MAVERALLPPSRPPPVSAGASRWEELAIDCEALPADGSLPRERTSMSGRGRAGEGVTMGGCPVARAAPTGLCIGMEDRGRLTVHGLGFKVWRLGARRGRRHGRMMCGAGGQPAESQTRRDTFFDGGAGDLPRIGTEDRGRGTAQPRGPREGGAFVLDLEIDGG